VTVKVQGADGTSIESFDVQVLAAFKELPLTMRLRAAADAIEVLCSREGWDTASFGPGSLRHAADEVEAEDSVAADIEEIAQVLHGRALPGAKWRESVNKAFFRESARKVLDIISGLGYSKGGGE
jgi:hypothetical protein